MSRLEAGTQSPRQRIIDGAMQAFLTYGYDGASMRKISEHTGYSQAGISHYFTTKSELLDEVFDQAAEAISVSFENIPEQRGTNLLGEVWRQMGRHRNEVGLWCVVMAEASTTGHPAAEKANAALLNFDANIAKTFPEIIHPKLMTDIWIGLMVAWLYLPHLDVPQLLADAHIALSRKSEFVAPDEVVPSNRWIEQMRKHRDSLLPLESRFPGADTRKNEIVATATEIFGEAGYVHGSLRTIAKALGITHPALLRHYQTKDDLFQAVLNRCSWTMLGQVGITSARTSLLRGIDQAFRAAEIPGLVGVFTAAFARSFGSNTDFHEFFMDYMHSVTQLNEAIFEELSDRAQLRPDLNSSDQARIYTALWFGAQIRWSLASIYTSKSLKSYLNQIVFPPIEDSELEINIF